MSRTSTLIALVLGLTALGSATVPTAAKPSPHFGGTVSLPSKVPSIARSASIRPSSQGLRLKPAAALPSSPIAGPHPIGLKVPTPVGSTGGGSASQTPSPLKVQVPGGQTGPGPFASQKPGPLKVPMPANPPSPPQPQPTPPPPGPTPPIAGKQGHPYGAGPIVFLAPQIPLVTGVPVVTSVPVTGEATVAQPVGPVGGTCAAGNIPPLGAAIDELLPTAQLSTADMTKVGEMRQQIRSLAANGQEAPARGVEEAAMQILGYNKLWLRCGYGTFTWIKQVSAAQPVVSR